MKDKVSEPGFRRMKWAALVLILGGLTALAGWGVYKIPAPIANRILENEVRQQVTLWQRSIAMHTEPDELRAMFQTGIVDEHNHEFLNLISATSDMFRLHLINPEARVVWSTRPGSVGDTKTNPLFHTLVANGGVLYVLEE